MSRRLSVAVLYGGISSEHEVSVTSARGVLRALDPDRFEIIPIAIAKTGAWRSPPLSPADMPLEHGTLPPVDPSEGEDASLEMSPAGARIASSGQTIDVCFPVLHGTGGEDGTIQGYLETMGLPYVGSGVAASALAMNKHLAKPVLAAAGIDVVPWITVTAADLDTDQERIVATVIERIGLPCFVKPTAQGSSVGVHKAHDIDGLIKAMADAIRFDGVLLVERAVDGLEIECSVLGNQDPKVSIAGQITPCNEFYDYEAKYLVEGSELTIPAALDDATTARVRDIAVRAFRALGCEGLARVDSFVAGGEVFCNEINTMPGFTPISMYPKLWEASGLSYPDLLVELIELALERHARRAR